MGELKKTMRSLILLQACDSTMKEVLERKQAAPEKVKSIELELEAVEERLREAARELEESRRLRREAEREIEELETRAVKSQAKLDSVKSNKEYRAALKEVDDLKFQKEGLEDRVLEMMESIEAMEEKCKALETEREQAQAEGARRREEIQEEVKALEDELEKLRLDRERLCRDVEEDLLKRYDLIRGKKAGVAVCSVLKGICQACNMALPPQRYNELIAGEELMDCPNCHRLVYWGEDAYYKQEEAEG